jgi:prepilin signal peptidase PulO-like enzyme (type II secretory pathway)
MEIMNFLPLIIGLLGLIVGSFLNVVILRYGTDKNLGGRSHCPKCNHQLSWYELIPVVSYVIQLGKCRSCKEKISSQYFLVELMTAAIFFFISHFLFLQYSYLGIGKLIALLIPLVITAVFAIIITVYDIRHKLVPFLWFLLMVLFSLVFLIVGYFFGLSFGTFWQFILFHILGLAAVVPFLAIWLFSSGKYIGFADVEIIAWIGFFFGLFSGVIAVITAFYIGAIFALIYVGYHRVKGHSYASVKKVQIPFAPFLLFAWLLVLLAQSGIISLFSRLFL